MTTPYDPFARGAHPVGVRSDTWTDPSRDRALPVEIWYPAASAHAGQDLDPSQQDAYPAIWITEDMDPDNPPLIPQQAVRDAAPAALPGQLILFAHGYAGHRREATYLCTHLASHGYVVVSADHLGFTSWEVDAMMADDAPIDMAANRHQMGIDRLGDVPFLVAAATEHGYAQPGPIGVVGISLGGWTALISPAVEPRVTSIVPLCPAGGRSPIQPNGGGLRALLDLDWSPDVACLLGVADRDSWLPLYGQLDTFAKLKGPSRALILQDADHNHFCDGIEVGHAWFKELTLANAEILGTEEVDWVGIARTIPPFEELVAPDAAYALWRGASVAHFDATLRASHDAGDLLAQSLVQEAARVGARVLMMARNERA